jgi:hypothetical protein
VNRGDAKFHYVRVYERTKLKEMLLQKIMLRKLMVIYVGCVMAGTLRCQCLESSIIPIKDGRRPTERWKTAQRIIARYNGLVRS